MSVVAGSVQNMARNQEPEERMSRQHGTPQVFVTPGPQRPVTVMLDGPAPEPAPAAPLESQLMRALVRWDRLELSERLARRLPDEHLYGALECMDLDAADDAALVEVVAAADRLEAAAHAKKVAAAARLAERRSMNPMALASHEGGSLGVAGDELAVRLRTSHKEGTDLVRRAKALDGPLACTGEALARGAIDARRARVIVDGLEHVAWQVAMAVEDRVLPRAAHRTVAQLRGDIARELIAVDADEAARRAEQRAVQRRISRPRAETDGMASMRIEGPAADVLTLDTALHATAKSAKAAGDRRSMDQLRFDALAGVAHRALETGYLGAPEDGRSLATSGGRRPSIHVTIPLDQLLPVNSAAGGGASGTGEHASNSADRGNAADEAWTPVNPDKHLDESQIPELAGYGPISPAVARALAAGGDWRRIVTDPLTGAVLDVGHTRYRPTQAIADHVRARDRMCVRPGCGHRAHDCELDHTEPYDLDHPEGGGRTAVTNLGPLCLWDHQLKTHGDFILHQTSPGVFEWTTPTGHRYRRERDGTTTPLTYSGRPVGEEERRPPPF